MNHQYTLIGLFAIILLVVSPYNQALSDHKSDLESDNIDDSPILKRAAVKSSTGAIPNLINSTTTIPITTPPTPTSATDSVPSANTSSITAVVDTTTTIPTETSTLTQTTSTTNATTTTTTESPAIPTTTTPLPPTISTTTTQSPIPANPSRKFDGLSFIGGMILAFGLAALIYLVVHYLRRGNKLPYSNLR